MKKFLIGILILIIAFAAIGAYVLKGNEKNAPDVVEPEISVNSKLYFSDESSGFLVARSITMELKNEDDKYIEALNSLIKGPEGGGLYPTLNENTRVNKVKLQDGLITVDFSKSLLEYNTGGYQREFMCIFSIVNTLCEFEEVSMVRFTVDGEIIETFGQFDMTEPYQANLSIVK